MIVEYFSECIFCGKKEFWATKPPKVWVCPDCSKNNVEEEKKVEEAWHDF